VPSLSATLRVRVNNSCRFSEHMHTVPSLSATLLARVQHATGIYTHACACLLRAHHGVSMSPRTCSVHSPETPANLRVLNKHTNLRTGV
jgi:hypothetical protein